MRILVSGSEGQLARSLAAAAEKRDELDLVFAARPAMDMAAPGQFAATIANVHPALVINAAAYTAVDKAEQEGQLARRINAEAVGEGAKISAELGIPFVHLSTDYVFNGESDRPWREDDAIGPINAYGRTKLAGEEAVRAAGDNHLIIRTSWVMSPFGTNFAKTMLRLARQHDELRVVDDQRGSPTSALDLAEALLDLAPRIVSGEVRGTYHLANNGEASWADVAEVIVGDRATVARIPTEDYPTPAARPRYSVLDCSKAKDELGVELRDWREAIDEIATQLVQS